MQKQNLDQGWLFYLGYKSEVREIRVDETEWQTVDLPHDWSIGLDRDPAAPSEASGGFFPMGRGWYRKKLAIPESLQDQKVWLEFEGIYMNSEVWLNEHFLGRHPYGYTSFYYDLTPYLNFGAENLLRIFVDNACQMNSRWYSGSGIYRHVNLLIGNPVHVAHWGISVTTPAVSQSSASVSILTRVENQTSGAAEIAVVSRILNGEGKIAGVDSISTVLKPDEVKSLSQAMTVDRPQLWSPDAPSLYVLETEILVAGQIVDAIKTPFGIRSLQFDAAQGFRLNGQSLKLNGGCVHHDNGVLGAASYDRAEERKVELLKASGFNAVRCAHNPPAPAFLDACDRLGILVIDEAFDCWRHAKTPGDYHTAFDDWWQRDLESMVTRDRNHPCIIIWSIGNEIAESGRPEGAALAHQLASYARNIDPTRPVTAAVCEAWQNEWAWPKSKDFYAALDIGGYNYQRGQYHSDHSSFPQRVMLGTESFPKEAFENWKSVLEDDWVLGDFVWTALDYLGEAGIGRVYFAGDPVTGLGTYPWHQANCGDLDLCGFKHPQSYYRDVLWGVGSPLYIAVHTPVPAGKTPVVTLWGWPEVGVSWTWPGHEDELLTVDIYSACEQVELFLNGRSLGIRPTTRKEKLMATFEVPYQPGELKVVGFKDGRPAAETSIGTAGAPDHIRLISDRLSIKADGQDLSYITVEIVDAHGRLHPHADHTIEFSLQGNGSILAVGSADPLSTENYRGRQRKAFHGRCQVVVKSTGTPGEIQLQAQAAGLIGAEVTINKV